MEKIGITTTVPAEVLLAAGLQPVDLNNVLIADRSPERLVGMAEKAGFPLNCCSWIKGIYGVCLDYGIDRVIGVTGGDCSNTLMLMDVLRLKGIEVIPFAYPDEPDPAQMQIILEKLARALGTTLEAASRMREGLKPCRELALELDELTWQTGLASGWENHLWLVSASDFNGDHLEYAKGLQQLLEQCQHRHPYPADCLRLAYIGVPPVYARDLYRYLEQNGARVVFNEVQRQFAMPEPGGSLAEQYSSYTYPYSTCNRLRDILAELPRRRVDGVIHYVQAFCHRGIADIVLRDAIRLPMLTLEGNNDFFLTSHTRTRLEAFVDMLRRGRKKGLSVKAGSRAS